MAAYLSRCRRALSVLRIDANGSSLLPTLTVAGNYNRKGASPNSGDGLRTALLPTLTPTQRDNSGGESPGPVRPCLESLAKAGLLPTLTASVASRGTAKRGPAAQGGPSLPERLMLPTLTMRDEKGPGPAKKTKGGVDLPQSLGGHLNPDWCRWFMGFPAAWLDVDDAPAFVRSATPSSRSAPKSSAG